MSFEKEAEKTLWQKNKLIIKALYLKGKKYIDIRKYYPDKENKEKLLPTKRGVMLNIDDWKDIFCSIDEITQALELFEKENDNRS